MRKRFALFGVLALVLALLMPSSAFAWDWLADGVFWRGNTSQGMYGVCVHAGNQFDAAAWVLYGRDPSMLTSEVRSKLSDPNHGGRFYEYAQTFSLMEDLTQYPEWLPAYVGVANIFVNGLAGDVNFYTSNVSESLYSGAKIDFQRVLAGEDLGGGGGSSPSSVPSGRYYEIELTDNISPSPADFPVDKIYYSVDLHEFEASHAPVSPFYFYILSRSTSPANTQYIFGPCWASNASANANNLYLTSHFYNRNEVTLVSGRALYIWNGSDSVNWGGVMGTNNFYNIHVFTLYKVDFSNTPIVTIGHPSGDWPEPETPATPEPPEVPTPTAPTVTPDPEPTQPTPTWPDITINIPAAPTVEVTPTGLDYTELLTRINDNLNTINSYTVSINSGLNSLRSDLVTEFESVEQGLRNIYQFLQHMDSMLERHCQHLRDALSECTHHLELYMKELFEWLPQQLNFDAEFSYDDSAVTSLLRAILNKIPGGSSGIPDTFKPNPQADEPGFFDWLTDLWHRFLIDLVSVLPDEIGGLVDAFSQLTHYFPFSIPWDLAAMLALFEHEPVTPVFDVPWGFGGNEGDVEMIRVDLSPWDGVMQMVRPVFVVGFCWQLALITKDLLAGLDLNKGGV